MHDTGDVRRRRTSSLVDTEAEMSASTSARDRDSGIRTTLSATILAPRGRRPRGNLCMAAGSRLVWRVEHLTGVESVRETRSSRSTDETSPRCRQTGSEHWQRSASAVKGQPGSRSPCCATCSQRPKASRGQGHQRCATYSQRSKASRGQGHRVV